MPVHSDSESAVLSDDRLTLAAIAVLAFILADVAHEVVGHGIGFFLAGGRSGILTTTRLISQAGRLGDRGGLLFDMGGPCGNLGIAALALWSQRLLRRPAPRFRFLLWLVTTFSLFWAFGYLIFCGVVARGDWFALIQGSSHLWLGRVVLIAAGILLYRISVRLTASELHWVVSSAGQPAGPRVRRLVLYGYVSGGLIACAGAIFDPRGAFEILNSGALSSFAAALGLLWVPRLFPSTPNKSVSTPLITRSPAWIVVGASVAIFFIAILGPGIPITL